MKNQSQLNQYFGEVWTGNNFNNYKLSGFAIADKIAADEWVLDVGCGYNPFKGKIKNLIGIDPANDAADIKVTAEEFTPDRLFNVALCLGSVNFGEREDVENQIACIVRHLTPTSRIYWRCNPGLTDHQNDECKVIPFYPWSIAEHVRLAEKFGFRLMECQWDIIGNDHRRIYAEWYR
jgi:hypothetical protein